MNISEQVKELRGFCIELEKYGGWWNNRLSYKIKEAADTIEFLSAKLADMGRSAEDCGGGWILCKRKMPEVGKPVLVCDKQGNVCVRTITCKIKGKKYWSKNKCDVIAWKPLPEPNHSYL